MMQRNFCEHCGQKSHCRDVFSRLDNAGRRSVLRDVLVAFGLPMVVFIGVLTTAQRLFGAHIESDNRRTVVAVLLALGCAAVCVLVARVISKRLSKDTETPG